MAKCIDQMSGTQVAFQVFAYISSLKKKKKRFILYWSIADKQCCDNFRWTANGLNHIYTCIHSLPNSLPIQSAM